MNLPKWISAAVGGTAGLGLIGAAIARSPVWLVVMIVVLAIVAVIGVTAAGVASGLVSTWLRLWRSRLALDLAGYEHARALLSTDLSAALALRRQLGELPAPDPPDPAAGPETP